MQLEIMCPSCEASKIQLESAELLEGDQFACPACGASVGIETSSRPVLEHSLNVLDDLRRSARPRGSA